MPFALAGFTMAITDHPDYDFPILLLKVIFCMIFGRSAAMAFNRWLDRDIDAKNPRTIIREIPAGTITADAALWFVIANCILFVTTAFFINPICFILSPVALTVILGYSYTKRFTALCHLVLGLGLALAPVGAYMAVAGKFEVIPVILGISVLFWVAGFDIIYALQDRDFDKDNQLNSIPVVFGNDKALHISELFHFISAIAVIAFTFYLNKYYETSGWLSLTGLLIFLVLLIYQHLIVRPTDLSRVNLAFFTTNGIASLIFGSLVIFDLIW
jgi:4-hydroxybenzoate polyprenyltransferase